MKRALAILALLVCLAPGVSAKKKSVRPYGGSCDVYCNPIVVKQMERCWMADMNGTARDGTWETAFLVECDKNGKITVTKIQQGLVPYRVDIAIDSDTIAIVHVHPNNGVSHPSQVDVDGPLPDYVISRDGLWLTDPSTRTYKLLRPFDKQFKTKNCK
jgi:hypothetical protein